MTSEGAEFVPLPYRRYMQNAAPIRRWKGRSNRAVLAGLLLMAVALLVSAQELVPDLATTVAAIAGFLILMYGVHLAWLVFYERRCQAGAEASCISRSTMSSSTSAKNVPTTSSISLNPSAQKSSGW